VETINTRLDVVQELTQTEDLFQGIRAVLSRFLDVDHLLSMCVQVPKEETLKTTDNWITTVIYLKHTLEEVEALRMVLCATETDNELLKSYQAVICHFILSYTQASLLFFLPTDDSVSGTKYFCVFFEYILYTFLPLFLYFNLYVLM